MADADTILLEDIQPNGGVVKCPEVAFLPKVSINDKSEINKSSVSIQMETPPLFKFVTGQGNLEELKAHLDQYGLEHNDEKQMELRQIDVDGQTILHRSVLIKNRINARALTSEILQHYDCTWDPTGIKLIDMQDMDGNTALHLAVKAGREKVASIVLHHKPDLALKNNHLKKSGETALELIQSGMPKLLRFQYDEGIRWVDEEQEQIMLNFNKLTESHYDFDQTTADDLDKHRESNNFRGVLKGRSENFDVILNHPLVQVFLYLKYKRAYPFIIASILGHVLWHATYAYFIFKIYYTNCPWKPTRNESLTGSDETTERTTINCDRDLFDALDLGLGVICWILAIFFLAKEAFEMASVPSKVIYFMELENIGQLFVCASVILTSLPVFHYLGGALVVSIHPWQYKLSAVTKSFGMFICTFASFLFAFAFSFCIMMPEAKAFTSPWLAVPKVLVMMTGELNYDDVFHGDSGSGSTPEHYFATQLLFSLFTILMSMVLLNMLIGLAVNDTQELRQQSHIAELYSMLQEIYLVECFAFRLHKKLRMPWLFKRLSINQDTQDQLMDVLTLFLFGRKKRCDSETQSMTQSITSMNKAHTKVKVDRGLFYKYNTSKRNEQYPFAEELMSKLMDIADERMMRETGGGKKESNF